MIGFLRMAKPALSPNDRAQNPEVLPDERRRDYELTLVLSAASTQENREACIGRLRNVISEENGEVIEAGTLRNAQLMYPIKKERQGFFTTLTFRGPTTLPKRIEESTMYDQTLLRFLLTERPKRRLRTRLAIPTPSSQSSETKGAGAEAEKRMEEQIEAALNLKE